MTSVSYTIQPKLFALGRWQATTVSRFFLSISGKVFQDQITNTLNKCKTQKNCEFTQPSANTTIEFKKQGKLQKKN